MDSKKQKCQNPNDELDVLLSNITNMESFITYLPKSQNPYLKTQEAYNQQKKSSYQNSYLQAQKKQIQNDQSNLKNSQAIKILNSNASGSQQTYYESYLNSYAPYASNITNTSNTSNPSNPSNQLQNPEFNQIKEYIFRNLLYVLCDLSDVQQTMNFFKSQDDKVYITIPINRLINSINLANNVLRDYNEQIKQSLYLEYQKAKASFDEFVKQLAIPHHPKVEECVVSFQKILSQGIANQIQLLQVDYKIKSIQWQTDQNNNEFQSAINKFNPGQSIKQDIDKILQARRKRTQQLLELNFPQAQQKNIQTYSYYTS